MQHQPDFLGFITLFAYAICGYEKTYLRKLSESARTVYSVMVCILSPYKTGLHIMNLVALGSAGFIKSSKNVLS